MEEFLSKLLLALLAAAAVPGCSPERPIGPSGVWAVVLGVAQDGGHPHLGCHRPCCESARRDSRLAHRVACLALVDRDAGKRFLIDATPDMVDQIALLERLSGERRGRPRNPVDGILLTHAHIGHYTGLMYLGRESMAAQRLPVSGTARMLEFLAGNGPWSLLISSRHIEPLVVPADVEQWLTPALRFTAVPVPHRDEYSDTVAYVIRGPDKALLWLPDIDAWDRWDRRIESVLEEVDLAFVDGTFLDGSNLPGRPIGEVPHPFMADTMKRLERAAVARGKVRFIHLNHSNHALDPGSKAAREVAARGFAVATEGACWRL